MTYMTADDASRSLDEIYPRLRAELLSMRTEVLRPPGSQHITRKEVNEWVEQRKESISMLTGMVESFATKYKCSLFKAASLIWDSEVIKRDSLTVFYVAIMLTMRQESKNATTVNE